MLSASNSILAATNVVETIAYYKQVFGFETSWTWGEPPTFGAVSWGPVTIMFAEQPAIAAHVQGHQHGLMSEQIDNLHAVHIERGAKIISPIEDKPWGIREYVVEDLNGYHLRFGGMFLLLLALWIFQKEFRLCGGCRRWRNMRGWLGLRLGMRQGIVALSSAGETVGVLRIMFDLPAWYSIWDVAVLPEWQGQHIGEAMMNEALAVVHDAAPGSFVYLFKIKQGFYEKLGFALQGVSLVRV